MTSKRTLERDIKELSSADRGDEPPMVLNLTGEGPDDDRHGALLTSSFPEHSPERESAAIPKLLPPRWWPKDGTLAVVSCAENEKFGIHPDGRHEHNSCFACELWEDLTDEELAAEAEYRKENDLPPPPLLEGYTTE